MKLMYAIIPKNIPIVFALLHLDILIWYDMKNEWVSFNEEGQPQFHETLHEYICYQNFLLRMIGESPIENKMEENFRNN